MQLAPVTAQLFFGVSFAVPKDRVQMQAVGVEELSNRARKYYARKNYSRALVFLKKANRIQPRNTDFLRGMVNCYMRLGDEVNGIRAIEKTLEIETSNDDLYYQLSRVHFRLGNIEETMKACARALEINPRELKYYLHLADVYDKTNQSARALELLERGLNYFPNDISLQIMAASSARRLGKNEECLRRLNALADQESGIAPASKIEYNFELGFIHDRTGSADLAFRHFARANEITRAQPFYQKVDADHSLNLIRNVAKLDFGRINRIIEVSRKNPPTVQPVFFVGFPRSGTTLLQKVLDSHPGIHVIEENNPLGRVTTLVNGAPEKYLQGSFLLNGKNISQLRDIYFSEARKYVPTGDGSLLVDKLPMNIVQVHVIKMLFPDARILLGLRHPCDCILSCFMQNFGINRAMANMFDFPSIIDYYDRTMGLWQLFKREIDFEHHAVRYEDLIENMEDEARKLLRFLGLPWDEEVLNYRQAVFKRGFINTPSYSQVVRPVYKEARYRWHRYAKHFEPYLGVLRPHCDAFGYSLQIDAPAGRARSSPHRDERAGKRG